MLKGSVIDRRPVVSIKFLLPIGSEVDIEFVVDTGFAGTLTLPLQAIQAMGLPYLEHHPVVLADGIGQEIPVFQASIVWNGKPLQVPVLAMGRQPLLGALMMSDRELSILFREGGKVHIFDPESS